ncbi:MAG: NADH-quinone oxidoreductase subunit NuoE [Bdellovibrionales bacterium]
MFELKENSVQEIKKELGRYETPYSAIIPSLYVVQKEHGWVSEEAIEYLSKLMDIPEADINEVNTFYTMFNKKPTGKYHLQVCCNISCSMAKARELTDHILQKLDLKEGEVTDDGLFTVSRVECLGSCDTAPVIQVGIDKYNENMTVDKTDQLIADLKAKG